MAFVMVSSTAKATISNSNSIYETLEMAATETGIPIPLIVAIMDVESGLHPWTFNVAGKGYYLESKTQALSFLKKLPADKVDIGLMQIHYYYWGAGVKKETFLDPEFNIRYGARILQVYINLCNGDVWCGVGRYSGNKPGYKKRVAEKYKTWAKYYSENHLENSI